MQRRNLMITSAHYQQTRTYPSKIDSELHINKHLNCVELFLSCDLVFFESLMKHKHSKREMLLQLHEIGSNQGSA